MNAPKERSAGFIIFRTIDDEAEYQIPKNPEQSNSIHQYLILQYAAGHWDFPKGHLEGSETPIEAAKRETFEETGIRSEDLSINPKFMEKFEYEFTRKDGNQAIKEVTFFLAKLRFEHKIVLSSEHKGYKWLKYSDALKQVTYKNAKDLLEKAESFNGQNTNKPFETFAQEIKESRSEAGSVVCVMKKRTEKDIFLEIEKFTQEHQFSQPTEEISMDTAKKTISFILVYDMAYSSSQLMQKETADSLASSFTSYFSNARFFTNRPFKSKENNLSSSWNPVSNSTFDCMVLAIDENNIAFICAEDED